MDTMQKITKEQTFHLFATLQALEKCLANSRKMLKTQKKQPLSTHTELFQQARILQSMRRNLNMLQLHLAKQEWTETVRCLQIFYGLNSMVRPDIMSTFAALANGEIRLQTNARSAVSRYH